MTMIRMADLDLKNQRVLIREDLNVPIKNQVISNDVRIQAALPTIKTAIDAGACVMIMSHLGRPEEGIFDQEHSLAPVAKRLGELLDRDVPLIQDWMYGIDIKPGEVVLCENVRFNIGEKANTPELAKQLASLCDIFVMDAFATSHRSEASTEGVIHYAPTACAGPLLVREISSLKKGLENPKTPVVAIVGGAKVSTKLKALNSLSQKVDTLIVGGGMANTFLAARGYEVGTSLHEEDLIDEADRLLSENTRADIPLPADVIVAETFSADAESYDKDIAQVDSDEKILDIGPKTARLYRKIINKANTILWNGPLGAFEIEQFSHGTAAIAQAIADSDAFSIAGGGDTIAAIDQLAIRDKISYISTGGGAFLTLLEGKELPAISALEQHAKAKIL